MDPGESRTAVHVGFAPDVRRAEALNARMHAELAASLAHLLEVCAGVVAAPVARVEGVIADLRRGRSYPASVFATYYELAFALQEERLSDAQVAWAKLGDAHNASADLEIFALGDPELGSDSSRFRALMNAGSSAGLGFVAPSREVAARFRERLRSGLTLLRGVLPHLSGEIEAIVRQIVIVGSDPTKSMQVDGGSHYQLWGALFLNGEYHADDVAVVEVLAHESAHSLLFGFCIDEGLVDNADDELYASPLRTDLRPMDGIYHATFVSARMHWAMHALSRSDRVCDADRERAAAAARVDLVNFYAGLSVIEAKGRLTRTGQALMLGARKYMDSVR